MTFVENLKVLRVSGDQNLSLIEEFYRSQSKSHTPRASDLFFVAMKGTQIIGVNRYCVEEGVALLRSMVVHNEFQRKKVGAEILSEFERYLVENNVKEVYCLPYAHLNDFYGLIGFQVIDESLAPLFLQTRLADYRKKPGSFICMKRTITEFD